MMRDIYEEIGKHHDDRGGNMLSPAHEFRHKKTGGLYKIELLARNEADMVPVVVYRNLDNGLIWVRPVSEWLDGRFEIARS